MRKNVYLFAGSDPLFDLSNGKGNLGVGEHLAHFKRGLGLISVDPVPSLSFEGSVFAAVVCFSWNAFYFRIQL